MTTEITVPAELVVAARMWVDRSDSLEGLAMLPDQVAMVTHGVLGDAIIRKLASHDGQEMNVPDYEQAAANMRAMLTDGPKGSER